jgi:carotenoid 1,2-hydratase
VPRGGYAWWYVDAASDDGRFGLSLIAFIGSAFSPYYRWASRRVAADPENHVALNVAIYGAHGYRWAMTERGRDALRRSASSLGIGPSRLSWHNDGRLEIEFDEVAVPLPRRVRGRVLIEPRLSNTIAYALDPAHRHHWQPIAPLATIAVTLDQPKMMWSGSAYLDSNHGIEPLANAFQAWNWSRTIEADRTRIFYDTVRRDGAPGCLHLDIAEGKVQSLDPDEALHPLPRSAWRLHRTARSDRGSRPRLIEAWEDGPFYARALVEQRLGALPVRSVHETLSLDRLSRPIVQAMLPFRMLRRPSLGATATKRSVRPIDRGGLQ